MRQLALAGRCKIIFSIIEIVSYNAVLAFVCMISIISVTSAYGKIIIDLFKVLKKAMTLLR